MEKIKILHISGTMNIGGQETFIMNILRNIDKEKYQIDIVVHSNEKGFFDDEIKKLGGQIYCITPISKGVIKHCLDLAKVIKKGNYKIIHRHAATTVIWIEMLTAMLCRVKKRIVHSHSKSNDRNQFVHKLNKPLLNLFTNCRLACSREAGEFLFGEKSQFKIIPNGIKTSDFRYSLKKRKKIRDELKIDEKTLLIGHIGRFTYAKNHTFILKIFKELLNLNSNIKLLLVGHGELENNIKKQIEDMSLKEKIIILENRNDIGIIMSSLDTFVFPSIYEGLPVTLVEAQAAGLYCIISNTISNEVDIIPEIIKRLSINSSATVWAKEILKYHNKNSREKYNNIIKKSSFHINNTVKMLEEIYLAK